MKSLPSKPTLEEVLWAVNGMKKEKMLLNAAKKDGDGYVVKCFTKKGGETYERLMEILRGVFYLSGRIDADMIFEDLQETLDGIVRGEP